MKRFVFCVAMNFLLIGLVFAQADLQPIANVKLVKSEPITIKQLKSRVDAYQKELGRVMTVDERRKVLDTLINEHLVVQAAERDGIKVTDSEVNENFNAMLSQQAGKQVTELEYAQLIKQQTGMSLDDFMKAQSGISLSEYKSFLKSQLIAQKYVVSKKQAELQGLTGPTDADIRSYYELYKQNFVQTDTMKLFLVVVPKSNNEGAQRKINDLYQQLKNNSITPGEMKIQSKAADSGFQAGDLYINKSAAAAQQLGISMEALLKIFTMDINDISQINETAKDYQCFVVQEKYSAKILDLGDLYKPGTTVTVYEYIKNNLLAQAQNKAVNEALVQIINDLRKPENFQILKTDADLNKALSW